MDRRFFILHSSFFIARYLRMKVLLSTYSCFPCKTSEPGNAWRAINEALREHEVWAVIADAHQYRELTLPVLQKNPLPNFHPIFQRLPAAYQWMSGHSATTAIYYHLWQNGRSSIDTPPAAVEKWDENSAADFFAAPAA